ncbi:glycosyltransferase [Streptomyces celluloflavus]|uniref:glycosyltransferase n=1 Tax=Streptomyces celluloflavus TaxID=58344 RepID=UPI0036B0D576
MGAARPPYRRFWGRWASWTPKRVTALDARQLAEVGKVPESVRVVDFIPLDALLPSCSATVHRGGFGTAQNALVHGAPRVVVPNDLWDLHPRAELISPDPLLGRSPWDTGPGAEPGAGKDRVPPALSASQGTGRRAHCHMPRPAFLSSQPRVRYFLPADATYSDQLATSLRSGALILGSTP